MEPPTSDVKMLPERVLVSYAGRVDEMRPIGPTVGATELPDKVEMGTPTAPAPDGVE